LRQIHKVHRVGHIAVLDLFSNAAEQARGQRLLRQNRDVDIRRSYGVPCRMGAEEKDLDRIFPQGCHNDLPDFPQVLFRSQKRLLIERLRAAKTLKTLTFSVLSF
jgi:hypothetical protein